MPCLNGKYNPQIGPVIDIKLVPAGTITLQNLQVPATAVDYPALIDTGATTTCISPAIAQALGISPVGKTPMASATHAQVAVNV